MGWTRDSIAVSRSFSACEASDCWRASRSRANCRNTSLLLCRLSRASSPNTPCNCSRARARASSRSRAQGLLGFEARAQQLRFRSQRLLAPRAPQQRRQRAERHADAPRPARRSPSLIRGRWLQPAQQIQGCLQVAVAAPGGRILVGAQVAIIGHQGRHARRMRGLHIALGVAHIDAFAGRHPGELRRVQQRHGMRFALGHRIAAHHAGEARAQSQLLEQRVREPGRLIGDDSATSGAVRARCPSTSSMPGKSRVLAAQRAAVNIEKAPLQGGRDLPPSASGNPMFTTRAAPWLTAVRTVVVGQRRKRRARARNAFSAPTMSGAVSSSVPSRSNKTARKGSVMSGCGRL